MADLTFEFQSTVTFDPTASLNDTFASPSLAEFVNAVFDTDQGDTGSVPLSGTVTFNNNANVFGRGGENGETTITTGAVQDATLNIGADRISANINRINENSEGSESVVGINDRTFVNGFDRQNALDRFPTLDGFLENSGNSISFTDDTDVETNLGDGETVTVTSDALAISIGDIPQIRDFELISADQFGNVNLDGLLLSIRTPTGDFDLSQQPSNLDFLEQDILAESRVSLDFEGSSIDGAQFLAGPVDAANPAQADEPDTAFTTDGNILTLGGDAQFLPVPFNTEVRGTAAEETLQLTNGANAAFAGNSGDRVEFGRDLSAYTFGQSGNQLEVARADGVSARLAVNGTFEVAFQDGSADVEIGLGADNEIAVTVGGEAAGPGFDPAAVNLDSTDPSQIDFGGDTGSPSGTLPDRPSNGGPDPVASGTFDSENIDGNQNGTISGNGGADRFIFDANTSSDLTIDDFDNNDQLLFNADDLGDIAIANSDVADGQLELSSGQASVTLTNIEGSIDGQVFDTASFRSAFGEDSLVIA